MISGKSLIDSYSYNPVNKDQMITLIFIKICTFVPFANNIKHFIVTYGRQLFLLI